MHKAESKKTPSLRELYPHFTEAQLKKAEENLQRYAEHALKVFERLERDLVAYGEFKKRLAKKERKDKAGGLAA